jgi:hypothetical protein
MRLTKSDEDFYGGVCCALAIVHIHGYDSFVDEIVATLEEDKLIAVARKHESMDWAGLTAYLERKKEREQWQGAGR